MGNVRFGGTTKDLLVRSTFLVASHHGLNRASLRIFGFTTSSN